MIKHIGYFDHYVYVYIQKQIAKKLLHRGQGI